MKQKVLIALLVAVTVLFLLAVVVGGSQGQGSAGDEQDLVELLRKRFAEAGAVPRSAVRSDCESDDDRSLLEFSGDCEVVVTSNWDDLRLLRLYALTRVTVQGPAPDGDIEVENDVEPDKSVSVAVGEGDRDRKTTIGLSCAFGAECRVRLL